MDRSELPVRAPVWTSVGILAHASDSMRAQDVELLREQVPGEVIPQSQKMVWRCALRCAI